MKLRKRTYLLIALLLALTLTGAGAILADDLGSKVAPGEIDDGGELLGQVTITLEDAIAAALAAEDGALGEVDIEHYNGVLVFNIDIGDKDVKVDAGDGTVLGSETDDDDHASEGADDD